MSESVRLQETEYGPNPNEDGTGDGPPVVSDREAYFQALRLWIHMNKSISNCFPYYLMSFQGLQNNSTNVPLLNNNYQFQGQQMPFPMPNVPRNVPEPPQPQPENLSPAEGKQIICWR